MRDPARIKRILKLLELVWERNPDLRLGQLVMNLARDGFNDHDAESALQRVFYVEDGEYETALKKRLGLLERLAVESDNA